MHNLVKRTTLAISLAALLPMVGAPAALADTKPLVDKEFETCLSKHFTKRFCNRIDASNEQCDKIGNLVTSTMDQTRPLRQEFRSKLLDLSALTASDEASDDLITAKIADIRALREKIADQRLAAVLKLRKILTHDQRKQIHDRVSGLLTGGIGPRHLSMLGNQ
jgi:Spy/CpxP family protein refolding chaperone